MRQDKFYFNVEADSFFSRQYQIYKNLKKNEIRENKIQIYNIIKKNIKILKNKNVLEIGCSIGDLLYYYKKKHKMKVFGVEPSLKAYRFAKKNYNISVEHSSFSGSSFFNLSKKNYQKFDLIICDDVLSWFDRGTILPSLGSIDWMLKVGGSIFIRDFCPKFNFCHPNHHWPTKKIYNFKVKNGHKEFLMNTGKYSIKYNKVYNSSKHQKIKIKNNFSNIWSDTILKKCLEYQEKIIKI